MLDKMKPTMEIEPKIKPLVNALNEIGLLLTFSSCQGHYEKSEQDLQNRNKADIRFDPKDNCSERDIEEFLNFLLVEFNNKHSFAPINLTANKLYSPNRDDLKPDYVYVIKLEPFDRFDNSYKKRNDTIRSILQATEIVRDYKSRLRTHL